MNKDRVVVITGAAGGIGALLVERFLANGDTVLATDIGSDALERLRGTTSDDAKLITAAADISREEDCEGLADLVREEEGRVEVLMFGFFCGTARRRHGRRDHHRGGREGRGIEQQDTARPKNGYEDPAKRRADQAREALDGLKRRVRVAVLSWESRTVREYLSVAKSHPCTGS